MAKCKALTGAAVKGLNVLDTYPQYLYLSRPTCMLCAVMLSAGLGLGLAQWSCLHAIEVNSDAVSNRSTDAHRDL